MRALPSRVMDRGVAAVPALGCADTRESGTAIAASARLTRTAEEIDTQLDIMGDLRLEGGDGPENVASSLPTGYTYRQRKMNPVVRTRYSCDYGSCVPTSSSGRVTVSVSVERFAALHHASHPLLLPNAWDAASAALLQELGAHAVATSSAAVAWSLGYADGGMLPTAELLASVTRLMRVMKVPLTVDLENGYSNDPEAVAALVQGLVERGVAGINLEDGTDAPSILKEKLDAIRQRVAPDRLFINARTDVFLRGLAPPNHKIIMTLRRAKLYEASGADGLFVPGVQTCVDVMEISKGTTLALNVMALPSLPSTADLFAAGMRRLSLGAAPFAAAYGVARDVVRPFLGTGSMDGLFPAGRLDYGAMNALITSSTQP